jgi:RND family efflux transporter MFP subunit
MKHLLWINAALAITMAIASCNIKGETIKNSDIAEYPVTAVIAKDTVLHHNYVADIQAVRNVEIRARVKGFLDNIYADEGQEVKKGQLLFRINAAEYKAELAKAKAMLSSTIADAKAAGFEVERVRMLVEKKVIAATELEVATAKQEAINARIDEARSAMENIAMRLSYTDIRAPFDGIIDRIPLKAGSLIDEGTLLTTVSDTREMYAYFNVSETEYLEYIKLNKSQEKPANKVVQLILADGSIFPWPGKIETIEGEFEENTGAIAFRARFANPGKLLKHGASGKVQLDNSLENALIVPQKAVFEMQDKNYVFVVDAANKIKMKSIVPKTRFSHFYVVAAGLEQGEQVIYEGVRSCRDGMQIRPLLVSVDSLINAVPRAGI